MYGQMGMGGQLPSNQSNQFEKLERLAKLTAPPPVKFKDLQSDVTHRITYNLVPFGVRVDFARITGDAVLTPITIQIKNKDITFPARKAFSAAASTFLAALPR